MLYSHDVITKGNIKNSVKSVYDIEKKKSRRQRRSIKEIWCRSGASHLKAEPIPTPGSDIDL